jgi:hypothetical protein
VRALLHAAARGGERHRDCDIVAATRLEGAMYWIFVGVITGVAFAWVSVRRRRKAGTKIA